MVRVMHPEYGMGIEFASGTLEQRAQVGSFIGFLYQPPGTQPQLLITPRALAASNDKITVTIRHPTEPKTCYSAF